MKPSTRPMLRWVGGIEAAHALDLVAEEVEPERLLLARREEVDEAAAHRIFAGVGDGVGARIAVGLQQGGQPLEVDPLAGASRATSWRMRNGVSVRWSAGVDRGDEQLRPVGLALQRVQGRQPLGGRAQRRRAAVVGQAVPGREGQDSSSGAK